MTRPGDTIDALVLPPIEGGLSDLAYLFPDMKGRLRAEPDAEELLAEMLASGVDRALLSIQRDEQFDWVVGACRQYPQHFSAAIGVDPRNGMAEVRRVRRALEDHAISALRFGPWNIQKPPTDRIYWPFFALAVEHDVPVQINVGIPGPKKPGWTQDPIYVDEVCYEFPELTVVMTHVGVPWTGTVIRNLIRWDNCFLVMNSYAPRHWPRDLLDYICTRGQGKVLFGTEYPLLTWERSLREIGELNLRDDVLRGLLHDNAARVFKWG